MKSLGQAGAVVANIHVDDRAAFVPCLNQRLYAFGLAESLRFVWPGLPLQPVAAAVIVLATASAMKSSK